MKPFASDRKKLNRIQTRRSGNGFSIIQVIVSIVVFSMTLSTTAMLVGNVVKQGALNKERITAIYLAQECVELVRNIRDTAWKQYYPWDCAHSEYNRWILEPTEIKSSEEKEEKNCQSDFGAFFFPAVDGDLGGNTELFIRDHRYRHNTTGVLLGEPTGFHRILERKEELKEEGIQAFECLVWWDEDQEIRIPFILSDWKKE